MTLTLYTISGAPRAWRALLGLAFKGVKVDIRLMSFSEKDHLKSEFMTLNPRATVPVLDAGSTVLSDSIAILAWLDRKYPENPLFGSDAAEAGEIWQITLECCDYLRAANHAFLSQVYSSDGSLPANGSEAQTELRSAADLVHAECHYLENILADGRDYLSGNTPGAADAVAYPEVRLLQRGYETKQVLMASVGLDDLRAQYPNLAAWKNRLNEDPAVIATLPPHWHP